jgi:hypothetical protein
MNMKKCKLFSFEVGKAHYGLMKTLMCWRIVPYSRRYKSCVVDPNLHIGHLFTKPFIRFNV